MIGGRLIRASSFLLAMVTVVAMAVERPWNVVILNDGDPTLPAFVALDRAIRAELRAPGRHPVDVFSETLDMLRFPTAQIEDEIVALLTKKYKAMRVDAVIVAGAASLDFAERHRSRLWPDARIVFSGVPVEVLRSRHLSPTTTGTPLQHDFGGMVEIARGLRPDTRRLVVISGSGDFDRMMAGVARAQLEAYAKRVTIEYWQDATVDEFLRRVAQLDSSDAVLYLSVGRDADGRTFVPRDVLRQLSSASRAPFYGPFETYLGNGIVAGTVYSFESRGKRLGNLVHEVLSSPTAATPALVMGRSSCMADASELDRLGLNAGRLPAGCEVRNLPRSLWREYRAYVLVTLAVVLTQAALILALVLQRRARRRAEDEARHRRAELAQASRLALAGELTASIAHEINQPLGAILANAGAAESMLRRGVTSGEELRAIIEDIKQADIRAGEVIRRVRALVTTREVEREVVDVNAMVRDVLAFLHGEAERRSVVVEATYGSDLPSVMADRIQLQQVMVNLCVNALDAMAETPSEKRRLGVRTRGVPDGAVEIAVSDTGPGIPREQLPRLFDSFFTTKPEGMGLGLSISRSIVEDHGGTLSAENRDGGALFLIALPPYREGDTTPVLTPTHDAAAPSGTIPAGTLRGGSP